MANTSVCESESRTEAAAILAILMRVEVSPEGGRLRNGGWWVYRNFVSTTPSKEVERSGACERGKNWSISLQLEDD